MLATYIGTALNELWPNAPAWLSLRVFICVASVLGLILMAILMRGLQRLMTVLILAIAALGGYWLLEDLSLGERRVLPEPLFAELDQHAKHELEKPESKAAWETLQRELQSIQGNARSLLAAGGDAARSSVAKRIEAKAIELRKQGKRTAAEELMRLKAEVSP